MMDFGLSYAGTPFLLDMARIVRMDMRVSEQEEKDQLPPRKHQSEADLIDELERLLPRKYLQDFSLPNSYQGRNLGAMANDLQTDPTPNPDIDLNCYYYPVGAGRFSVFRGLATSSMAKAMLTATKGYLPKPFILKANPISPNNPTNNAANYTIKTNLYMLPPRPLAEHGGPYDGLYLITLVDERYYWQGTPVTIRPTETSTWASLIQQIAAILNVSIVIPPIPAAYVSPALDSQFYCNQENAAFLLDAIVYNVGSTLVRNYDGTYNLQTPLAAQTIINANRGNAAKVVRIAGGDIFSSGTKLPVSNLGAARNSVVPTDVFVTFPKYVIGDDPVPHFVNSRFQNPRPSSWFEESYGDVYTVDVPIASGGPAVTPVLSGGTLGGPALVGVSDQYLHDTAKALYSGDVQLSNLPLNSSGLIALAMQMAQDLYYQKTVSSLDEVYPGTFAWVPEGIHDIVWTYSAKNRIASTRVMRVEWNSIVSEFQHAAPALSGFTNIPRGVGGKVVAQTWRDSELQTAAANTTINVALGSGTVPAASFTANTNFPSAFRWVGRINSGQIDDEIALFEGTSGGTTVGIVYRGIYGSLISQHANGAVVTELLPNTIYGANLVTLGSGLQAHQGAWTSGGICEVIVTSSGGFAGGGTITGPLTLAGNLFLTPDAITPAPGSLIDWNPGTPGPLIQVQLTGNVSLYSFSFATSSQFFWLYNVSTTYYITIYNDDGSTGTVTQRITTPENKNVVVQPGGFIQFWYDPTAQRFVTGGANVTTRPLPGLNLSPSSDQNDYNVGNAEHTRFTPTVDVNLTGIGAQPGGHAHFQENRAATQKVTLQNQNAGSVAANRFRSPTGRDYPLRPNGLMLNIYDVTSQRWNLYPIYDPQEPYSTVSVTLNTDQNDYNPGIGEWVWANITALVNLTGLLAEPEGTYRYFVNVGTNNLVLKNQNVGSASANQFKTSTGSDLTIAPGGTAVCVYDSSHSAYWRVYPLSSSLSSGQITSGYLGDASVVSGSIASGVIGAIHISSGGLTSGAIASGTLTIFNIASGGLASGSIASGSITNFNIASGTINAGLIASGGLQSGAIGSGQITPFILSSGCVQSGNIGDNAVNPNNIPSGSITGNKIAAGAIQSGHLANGSVVQVDIASGQVGTNQLAQTAVNSGQIGINAVVSGNIASGAIIITGGIVTSGGIASGTITSFSIASGGLQSGSVGSGTISTFNIASGGLLSGAFGSGQISTLNIASGGLLSGAIGSGQIGQKAHASGAIQSGQAGDGSICSGSIASGTFAPFVISGAAGGATLTSGQVTSGYIGNTAVVSGSFASGSINQFALSSGIINSNHMGSGSVISGTLASGLSFDINGLTSGILTLKDMMAIASGGTGNRKIILDQLMGYIDPAGINDFRISLLSGVAVPSTDQTTANAIYLVPYKVGTLVSSITVLGSGRIALPNGSGGWVLKTLGQLNQTTPLAISSGKNYDVIVAGGGSDGVAPAIDLMPAWATDTGRTANTVYYQDGVPINSGGFTGVLSATNYTNGCCRIIGSVKAITSGELEDSSQNRLVINIHNAVPRPFSVTFPTNWAQTSGVFREVNNSTAYRVTTIAPIAGIMASVQASMLTGVTAGVSKITSIGEDSATSPVGDAKGVELNFNGNYDMAIATVNEAMAMGYHYFTCLEKSPTGSTDNYGTANGVNFGITGWVLG